MAYLRTMVLHWKDSTKGTCRTFLPTFNQAAPVLTAAESSFLANIAALSGCELVGVEMHAWQPLGAEPSESPYALVNDRALITGRTAPNNSVRFTIPGPVPAILEADLVTVDLSSPVIVPLLDAASLALADHVGNAPSEWLRGTRYGVKIGRAARV